MSRPSGSYGLTYYLVTAPCRVLWKAAGPLHVYIHIHPVQIAFNSPQRHSARIAIL